MADRDITLTPMEAFNFWGSRVLRITVKDDGWTRLYGHHGYLGVVSTNSVPEILSAIESRKAH